MTEYNAWNPGLESEIPPALMPHVTLYLPENSNVSYPEAKEAAGFCGLKPHDMVAFTVKRLAIHEILIRVTADLHVPDGPNYADLGLSLRGMAERILTGHVAPRLPELEEAFATFRADVEARLGALVASDLFPEKVVTPAPKRGFITRLLGKGAVEVRDDRQPELRALEQWQSRITTESDPVERGCLKALHAIVSGIVRQRGRLVGDPDLIVRLAANLVCNRQGSRLIGSLIDPMIRDAAAVEGYRFLPFQSEPVILNVKGASAAGKSTIRPLQRKLAERLGVRWEDFALISPDYWRKFLLDYESLGENFKYAAMLTGQELEIIDKKLDGYMSAKAKRSEMPHLLIDRFRFDSFSSDANQPSDGRLLSRFGHTVFMFFVITPPAETVERAWKRGLLTGRFKAVDDLLYHNIEAYTGMPQLFFTWVKKDRQKVHFEFLDNSVRFGERPRTVAFGWNDKITVLDPGCMRRLAVYRNIDVDARRPDDVLERDTGESQDILSTFIKEISDVTFADPASLTVLGQTHDGIAIYERDGFFEKTNLKVKWGASSDSPPVLDVETERKFTVGSWGPS